MGRCCPEFYVAILAFLTLLITPDDVRAQSSCEQALGMENGDIADAQITGRSRGSLYHPHFARLRDNKYWLGETNWGLQIDLLAVKTISNIAMQGSGRWFVRTYTIHHSLDGLSWTEYRSSQYDGKQAETLPGVTTSNSLPVNYTFIPTFQARYVVVQPKARNYRAAVRLELYGCDSALTAPQPTVVNTDVVISTEWTAPRSPYVIDRMVRVIQDATLTIRPGTSVIFTKRAAGLIIDGELIATGTPNQEIFLMSSNPSLIRKTEWEGVKNSKGVIQLTHTVVKNSAVGINSNASNTTISDSTFLNNDVGIKPLDGARSTSHAFVVKSHFINNVRGIFVASTLISGTFVVDNCVFDKNIPYGFEMNNVKRVNVRLLNSRFTNNRAGVRMYSYADNLGFFGSGLTFEHNQQRGIEYSHYNGLTGNHTFNLYNSSFTSNGYSGLYLVIQPRRYLQGILYSVDISNNRFDKDPYGIQYTFRSNSRNVPAVESIISNNTFTGQTSYSLYLQFNGQLPNIRWSSSITENNFINSHRALHFNADLRDPSRNVASIKNNFIFAITHDPAMRLASEGTVNMNSNRFINCTSRTLIDITKKKKVPTATLR